ELLAVLARERPQQGDSLEAEEVGEGVLVDGRGHGAMVVQGGGGVQRKFRLDGPRPVPEAGGVPLSAYLDLTIVQAEQQWRAILTRPDLAPGPAAGQGRVNHLPVETLLAGAVRLVANVRAGGGDRKFPYPVPELARLFRRKPNAVASKVQNLSGVPGRNRGARTDIELGRLLAASPPA